MIINYFKVSWRNILKYRRYTIANVLGLFLGIVFILFISLYIWSQLEIHNSLKNSGQQYILKSEWKDTNMGIEFTTLGPLAKQLKDDYPTLVANYYRFDGISSIIVKEENRFREEIQIGDDTFLSMYGFELLYGDVKTALIHPFSVVITSEKAIKYFGKKDVVGERISIQNSLGASHEFLVTGVLNEIPQNLIVHLNKTSNPTFFIPINTLSFFERGRFDSWKNRFIVSFIELKSNITPEDLEIPIRELISNHTDNNVQENLSVSPVLLSKYYLEKENFLIKRMLYALFLAAVFILLMAVINFVNISISMASSRTKEIGVRKVLGGMRKQLVGQFLTESFIMVLFSFLLALMFFSLLSATFSQLIDVSLPRLIDLPIRSLFIAILFIAVVSLITGLYPAFILSSLKSLELLRGKFKAKINLFQKALVGFQFFIALFILISAFVITNQVDYFFNKDLGYEKEHILSAQVPRDWTSKGVENMEVIRNEFEKLPLVTKVSLSYEIPNGNFGHLFSVYRSGTERKKSISMKSLTVDEHYFDTYKLHFTDEIKFDQNSAKVVLNTTAARLLGWKNPKDALGHTIKREDSNMNYTIKGVVNDFHFGSMKDEIQPIIFFDVNNIQTYRYLSFKIEANNIKNAVLEIKKKWNELVPECSFDYLFMDDILIDLYASEIQFKRILYIASFLSIIIALLGVIGIVSLSIRRRIKEICIRKILGASIIELILIFIKEFIFIMSIAYLIAIGCAYVFLRKWLSNYAYQVGISVDSLSFPFLILTSITFLLIIIFSLKIVKSNLIEYLKTE